MWLNVSSACQCLVRGEGGTLGWEHAGMGARPVRPGDRSMRHVQRQPARDRESQMAYAHMSRWAVR